MVELKEVFTNIYESNLWTSEESRSGLGSELKSTEVIRKELPELFKKQSSDLKFPCSFGHISFQTNSFHFVNSV